MSAGPGKLMIAILELLDPRDSSEQTKMTTWLVAFGVYAEKTESSMTSVRRALRTLQRDGYVTSQVERVVIGYRVEFGGVPSDDPIPIMADERIWSITDAGRQFLDRRFAKEYGES